MTRNHKGYQNRIYIDACRLLVGKIIRQAIFDYQDKKLKKTNLNEWKNSRDFIFRKGRLEFFLSRFEMEDQINIRMLRDMVRKKKIKFIKEVDMY